jgi:hypothetical protein
VLREFFKDFEGTTPPTSDICRIIAMNEGKLRDFFSGSTRHRWLSKTLLDRLQFDANFRTTSSSSTLICDP